MQNIGQYPFRGYILQIRQWSDWNSKDFYFCKIISSTKQKII